eukprot:15350952-Ditylum_brightwellii.AAC.1
MEDPKPSVALKLLIALIYHGKVLGAMCDPIPLQPIDADGTAALVLGLSEKAAVGINITDKAVLQKH